MPADCSAGFSGGPVSGTHSQLNCNRGNSFLSLFPHHVVDKRRLLARVQSVLLQKYFPEGVWELQASIPFTGNVELSV